MTAPRDLLTEYALGLLPPAHLAEMGRLVSASPELQAAAEQIRNAFAGLASALPPMVPSRQARARLLDRVAALPPAPRSAARSSGPRPLAFVAPPPVELVSSVSSVVTIAALAGIAMAGAGALYALNRPPAALLLSRAPGLILLVLAQVAGTWAALAPGFSRWAPVSWAAAASAAAVALAGHAGGASPAPGWICAVIQLLGGLVPLTLVVRALRGQPWSWSRAITAGLALGTGGFIWGEVECQRSALHVLTHHGTTWLVLLAACLFITRALRSPLPGPRLQ